MKKISALV